MKSSKDPGGQPALTFLKHGELSPCPENRPDRSGFTEKALAELALSITQQGLLQPLLVRPNPRGKGHEIICGERRWTAAGLVGISKEVVSQMKLARLETLPCIIRAVTDAEARELRIIENLQRADVHPIEEAKAYRLLLDELEEAPKANGKPGVTAATAKKKYTLESLAQRIGKSPSFIYARLKLLKMPKFAQDAMFAGKLDASVALLLCRIPDPKLAHKAACEVLDRYGSGAGEEREERALDPTVEAMSFRVAKEHVQQKYMIRLKGAKFDPEDGALVPVQVEGGERVSGGKCSDCPWRTGNLRLKIPDLDSAADVCTNPACFHAKDKAAFKGEAAKVKAQGLILVPEGKARQLLNSWASDPADDLSSTAREQFLDLREPCPGKKNKTWQDVLEDHLPEEPGTLLVKGKRVHHLLPIDTAVAAAKKAGVKLEKPAVPERATPETQRRQQEEREARRTRNGFVAAKAINQVAHVLINGLEDKGATPPMLRRVLGFLALGVCDNHDFMNRRGFEDPEPMWKAIQKMDLPAVCVALVDGAIGQAINWHGEFSESLAAACEAFGVDLKKLEAEAVVPEAVKAPAK